MADPAHPDCLPRWRDLARLSDDELGRHDIAAVNLAVAVGLPGSGAMDPADCLDSLDQWTEYARGFTEQALPRYYETPERWGYSEARFRATGLVLALQRGPGLQYNPAKIPPDAPFDVADYFAFGAIQGPGGTCSTMPIVYASVGRRLGYPIKLVSCRTKAGGGHRFNRWDGAGVRFNFDGTNEGCSSPPDDYFRTGHYESDPRREEACGFMGSLTPRQELAEFLDARAGLWAEAGEHRRAAEGMAWVVSLDPGNRMLDEGFKVRLNAWKRWANERKPPGFPSLMIGPPPRRLFPDTLPAEYERDLLGCLATEHLLTDPEYGVVWEKMRRGEWRGRGPNTATVDYHADGTSVAEVRFEA
ncbi:MAG: hypothetical protein K2X87_24960 [Gemmataceae bacterium]|nr:hypothetical protein [Gemmataceae bacterium]